MLETKHAHDSGVRFSGDMNSLNSDQIEQFIEEGFVRLGQAFPRELADRGRAILWRHTGCDPDDPTTWTKPVVWLGDHDQEPFRQAVNMPRLHAAFDQLVGKRTLGAPAQSRYLSGAVSRSGRHG